MHTTYCDPLSRALATAFLSRRDGLRAEAMSAYMKHQFPFYGISAPLRRQLVREVMLSCNPDLKDAYPLWVKECWLSPEREMQYVAIDILTTWKKWLRPDHLPMLEWMMVNKSWWDTVDGIAPTLAGTVFLRFPDSRDACITSWRDSENMWLNRASLIFQLKYRRETDWPFLQSAILAHRASREFFIRKAQGWALRQYARVAPEEVLSFVGAHPELSSLTKKEALKHLL